MKTQIALERSTNTHNLISENVLSVQKITESILKIKTNGFSIVTHKEHGTLQLESENIIKYVQQELNPVTKIIQNSFD